MTIRSPLTAAFAVLLLASCRTEIEVPVDPPEVRKDYAQTALNTPVTLAPLANDFDPTGQALDLVEIGVAANGVAVLNPDDSVTYTPNVGYTGGDSFAVWVRDTAGNRVRGDAYVSVGDSVRMYYVSNFEDYRTDQLYLADSNFPGVAIPVNARIPITDGPYLPSTRVETYTPNGAGSTSLLYVADDRDDASKLNIFLVDTESLGAAQQVTDIPDGFGMVISAGAPQITPDGLWVVYASTELNNNDSLEVLMVEIANPANKVRINAPYANDGDRLSRWVMSPDGSHVLYNFIVDADALDQTVNGMYSVDLSNPGVATKISPPPTSGTPGPVALGAAVFVPGTDQVLFTGTFNGANTIDLFAADYVSFAGAVKVNGTTLAGGVTAHAVSPDGTRVIYISTETDADAVDLYTVELANPGVSTQLSKVRTDEAQVLSFGFGTDGTYAVFVRDDDVVGQRELWRVDFANPTVRIKLNAPLATDEDVLSFRLSEGAPRGVLYASTVVGTQRMQIRQVDVDAPGVATDIYTPVRISQSDFAWSPDAQTMVLSGQHDRPLETSIFILSLAAPTALIKLSAEDDPGDAASRYSFLP